MVIEDKNKSATCLAGSGRTLIEQCEERELRLTRQRRVIANILDQYPEHLDADSVYRRAREINGAIAFSTVYRTLKLFESHGLLDGQSFGQNRRHFERADRPHHDHLIDVDSGRITEFQSPEIEDLQRRVADELGYDLLSHRLELFGRKKSKKVTKP